MKDRRLSSLAKALRKNQTDAERLLWSFLKSKQVSCLKFKRQATIGKYIVDFVCFEVKLVIEVDGGQHATDVLGDAERTAWLESQGFKVLRFWNNDVLADSEVVMKAVWDNATDLSHDSGKI